MARIRRSEDQARSFAGKGTEVWKYIGGGRLLFACHQAAPPATAKRKNVAANNQLARCHLLLPAGTRSGSPVCECPSAIQFNSLARSLALCQRSSGSFARHFLTTRASAGGVIGCKAAMGCGSEERMAAIKLARLFPANAGLPVAIS